MRVHGLTERTYRVAELIADGHTDDEIAKLLAITANGVRFHVDRIVQVWNLKDDGPRNIRVRITRKLLSLRAA